MPAPPTSRAALSDNYAARWNMPATGPATGAAGDALRLTADPMDEPVDVVIIVKDAAAIAPVAPTLTPPAANVAAPADGEKAK